MVSRDVFLQFSLISKQPHQHTQLSVTIHVSDDATGYLVGWCLTRSHKFNEKDHAGIAEGIVLPQDNLPKFFAQSGFAGVDPKKTKKNGGGRGNWGGPGEEVVDEQFKFTNARRRSNSSGYSNHLHDFKTKFEINEPEPVFEESIHGPEPEDDDTLTKTETSSSAGSSAEEKNKNM